MLVAAPEVDEKQSMKRVKEAINGENPVKVGIVPTRGDGGSEDRQFQLKTGEQNFSNF